MRCLPHLVPLCTMQSLVQRAYNAYAVRVVDEPSDASPSGGAQKAVEKRVVQIEDPTNQGGAGAGRTQAGELCIELRIRLYNDGAMSKLLEQLAKVGVEFDLVTSRVSWMRAVKCQQ